MRVGGPSTSERGHWRRAAVALSCAREAEGRESKTLSHSSICPCCVGHAQVGMKKRVRIHSGNNIVHVFRASSADSRCEALASGAAIVQGLASVLQWSGRERQAQHKPVVPPPPKRWCRLAVAGGGAEADGTDPTPQSRRSRGPITLGSSSLLKYQVSMLSAGAGLVVKCCWSSQQCRLPALQWAGTLAATLMQRGLWDKPLLGAQVGSRISPTPRCLARIPAALPGLHSGGKQQRRRQ